MLTHRVHLNDPPQAVDPGGWDYTDASNTAIKLTTGNFIANDIYEFSYIAKDPTVNGLGFAAIRDFNSFLRYAQKDDSGTPNPLAGEVRRIYTETSSQPGRTLNDFVHLGFNEDENRKKVFDGMMQWVAAGDGHQHELPLVADQAHQPQPSGPAVSRRAVPVRKRDDLRSDLAHGGRPLQEVRASATPARSPWSSIRPTNTG